MKSAKRPRGSKAPAKAVEEEEEEVSADVQLPISRISKVIRTDKDVNKVGRDALFAIAKSTELFLESLALQSAAVVSKDRRKTIQYKDFMDGLQQHPKPASVQFVVDELSFDAPVPSR